MKNIAVLLAGGVGSRLGLSIPKQFYNVGGRMIIEHSVDVFEKNSNIDEIYIVCNKQYIYLMEEARANNTWTKVTKVLNGGSERYESSINALKECEGEANVFFHDAVRPLVSHRIIDDVVEALKTNNAVTVAVPVTDTIVKATGDFVEEIPVRSTLFASQTPQAFKISTIKKAYELALEDKELNVTDDCGIVRTYLPGEPIYIVKGDDTNIKVTFKKDIELLENFLKSR